MNRRHFLTGLLSSAAVIPALGASRTALHPVDLKLEEILRAARVEYDLIGPVEYDLIGPVEHAGKIFWARGNHFWWKETIKLVTHDDPLPNPPSEA